MNILVVCHDYKKHKLLTLVLGTTDNDYVLLTQKNIPIISNLTNGNIAKIAFIDTDYSTVTDEYQYNNWDDVPNDFDYFFTIFCPGIKIDDYKFKGIISNEYYRQYFILYEKEFYKESQNDKLFTYIFKKR